MAEAKDQSKKVEANPAQEFVEKYNKLVQETGYQILSNPAFKMRDDGTWSIVLQTQVAEIPKQEK